MRAARFLLPGLTLAALVQAPAQANDRAWLESEGYQVIRFTTTVGAFHGCRPGQRIKLAIEDADYRLQCDEFLPGTGEETEVILMNATDGSFQFLVDGDAVDGTMFIDGDELASSDTEHRLSFSARASSKATKPR